MKYILTRRCTWFDNSPFDGAGVDAVYLHFHKANEFLGIQPLPTFICNDVVKNPQVERFLADYTAHLQRVFPV